VRAAYGWGAWQDTAGNLRHLTVRKGSRAVMSALRRRARRPLSDGLDWAWPAEKGGKRTRVEGCVGAMLDEWLSLPAEVDTAVILAYAFTKNIERKLP
jgi:hypothetical protein